MARDCRRYDTASPAWQPSHLVILVDAKGERLIVSSAAVTSGDPGATDAAPGLAHAMPCWPTSLAGLKWAMIAAREAGVPTVLDGDTGEREVLPEWSRMRITRCSPSHFRWLHRRADP